MSILLATAAVVFVAGVANADPYDHNQQNDSQQQNNSQNNAAPPASDQNAPAYGNGYNYGYDDGMAHRERDDHYRSDAYRHEARYDRGAYYYGSDCSDNNATGTLLGAVAGGLIGGAASHGNGGAVVGGVILGGIAGNAISSDMNCGDRRQAMMSYSQGFEGQIGHRYRWRNSEDSSYGSFTPVREYSRDGNTCRDYQESGYGNGHSYNHTGTACRHDDGNWYIE
jgi:surface antigen